MHHQNAKQIISLTILVGALLLAPLAQSQGPTPPPTPPPPHRGLRYGIDQQGILPLLPGAQPQARTADRANAPACAPWSKLAFASYRNEHDWDVYVANGDGTGQVRLTYHDRTDTASKYNRGCTRLVYQSLQGSQYEVYVMNADGSGQANLTNHPANDGIPCWSPDSARIAFQTERDDDSEVYVMNADGTGQTNLTNHSAYDGMPAWSPDGTQIAFVSNRTGQYEIWVMNPDGTGQTQVTHGVQWAEYPCWSPDGTQIVFSNDDDGDGFLDINVVNADGTGHMFLDGHVYQDDYWYPAWSPDGEWIAYGLTTFVSYQGQWYWTRSDVYAKNAPGHGYAAKYLVDTGYDWRPHWGTLDAQPPTSKVDDLTRYSGNSDPISWSGQDTGPSGIKSYDVQYRVGTTGTWTDWLTNTVDNFAYFPSILGTTVYFRCRARDRAHNVEAWPSGSDTSTTRYTWQLSGQVTDNRGTPLANVPITLMPLPLESAHTDLSGCYLARLITEGAHTLTLSRTGYAAIPPSLLDVNSDISYDFYLPPQDDVVQNGSFEASEQQLSDWVVSGTLLAAVTTTARHTGDKAAYMGSPPCPYPCLSDPEATWGGSYAYPDLATDDQGNVHMIWAESWPAKGVFYSFRTPEGTWTSPYQLGDTSDHPYSVQPGLAIDGHGSLHAVWDGNAGLYYSQKQPSDQWTAPIILGTGSQPSIAADSKGGVHVIYYNNAGPGDSRVCYLERLPSGTWQTPIRLDASDGSLRSGLAVGPDDSVHFVWQETNNGIFYRTRLSNGSWAKQERLFEFASGGYSREQQKIAVDADGGLHVFCTYMYSGYYIHRPPRGDWSDPVALSQARGAADLAVDSQGVVHMVGNSSIYTDEKTYYRRKVPGVGWLDPVAIHDDYHNSPAVAIDQYDILHTVWEDFLTTIQYQTTLRSTEPDMASIEQTVSIPENMHHPTLAFMYKLHGTVPTSTSGLRANVTNGITTSQVFSATTSNAWSLAWADLSPWAGQTVTITLTLQQEVGDPYATLFLDDISLGSAYPNLWVQKASPSVIPPGGGTVRYTIAYGNLGGVPAQTVRLTDTLPAGVAFVSASPAPTSTAPLIWDVGDLASGEGPHTIVVTATVDAGVPAWTTLPNTVAIGAATPEADLDNNTAVAQTFVGYRTYLPLAAKNW